jgi:catalase
VTLAEEGDPLEDPTVAWPENRTTITLGTMELTALDTESESGGHVVVFDPSRVTEGIECTDDEILAARPHAYAVSIDRRAAAARA